MTSASPLSLKSSEYSASECLNRNLGRSSAKKQSSFESEKDARVRSQIFEPGRSTALGSANNE